LREPNPAKGKTNRMGDEYQVDPAGIGLKMDFFWVHEYLKEVSDVRWNKVTDFRRQIDCGDWRPGAEKVAERILRIYLQNPDPF